MLYFRILSQDMNCVAAIGVVHFSVRGFGCALFYFRKEYENMKARKFSAVAAAATAVAVMLAGCGMSEQSGNSANSESPAMSGEISKVSTTSSADSLINSENVINSNVGDFSYDIGTNYDGSTCAKITGYHGTATDVTLPVTEYQGYKVTMIGIAAFMDSDIRRMVIPEGYTTFEDGAFADCTELEELYMPDSMEYFFKNTYDISIGNTFENCCKLTKLSIVGKTADINEQITYEGRSVKGKLIADCLKDNINEVLENTQKNENVYFDGTADIRLFIDKYAGQNDIDEIEIGLGAYEYEINAENMNNDGKEWTEDDFLEILFDAVYQKNEPLDKLLNYDKDVEREYCWKIIISYGECTDVGFLYYENEVPEYEEYDDYEGND